MKNSHTINHYKVEVEGFNQSNSHKFTQHIENTGLSQGNNEMNGLTFSVITNLAHARNRLAKLSMSIEEIGLLQEISLISEAIENSIYNVKAIGA